MSANTLECFICQHLVAWLREFVSVRKEKVSQAFLYLSEISCLLIVFYCNALL